MSNEKHETTTRRKRRNAVAESDLKQPPDVGANEVARVDPGEVSASTPDPLKAIAGSNDRRFNNLLLNSVLATRWVSEDVTPEKRSDQIGAAFAALAGFEPENEIEGMLAAQAVAMHLGAMECFRRAMHPEQPSDLASKLRKDGTNMARGMADMVEALDRKRGKLPQVMRVERVVVEGGGQAIVGNVAPSRPSSTERDPA